MLLPAVLLPAVLLAVGALAGCSTEDERATPGAGSSPPDPDPAGEADAPELTPAWSIPGLEANPGRTGPHHWLTYQSRLEGVGRGTTLVNGPMLLVDARTGASTTRKGDGDRWPCVLPSVISPGGVTALPWVAREVLPGPGNSRDSEPCQRMAAFDASTGRTLWRTTFDADLLSDALVSGATDDVVVLADDRSRSLCWAADDGAERDPGSAACRRLRDRLTGADLPPLTAPGGEEVTVSPFADEAANGVEEEIGRTDDVLLVSARQDDGTLLVRAHDLEDGRTLWQDVTLEKDPHEADSWARDETYFVAPSGIVHVTYEHPANADDVHRTPMHLTAVDPRTGADGRRVATVTGAWFNHQFDDVTVALTDQERSFRSRISGFELPRW